MIECDNITTWADLMAATPEQRRRFCERLIRKWEMNRLQEVAEDNRRDGKRGHWGD